MTPHRRDNLQNTLSPTARRSLADDATEQIRFAIIEGRLRPGEHLREETLAELLHISRGPVREALNRLESEYLVVKQPNRGAFVAELMREDVDEVYSLRLALEKLAIEQAVRHPVAEHLAAMQKIVDQMRLGAAQALTIHQAAELNLNFHETLCRASGHKRLHASWAVLRPQIYLFLLRRTAARPEFMSASLHQGHQDILDAVTARDQDYGVRLLQQHFELAYQEVIDSYNR